MTGNILRETHFDNLGTLKTGKVRDIYFQPDKLILVATDRHSSFDRIIAHIPNKGAVLNLSSAFWFRQTADIVPNHVIAIPDPNVTVAKRVKPLPVEAVVRTFSKRSWSMKPSATNSAGVRVRSWASSLVVGSKIGRGSRAFFGKLAGSVRPPKRCSPAL